MKRVFLILFLWVTAVLSAFPQDNKVYYYERVKISSNGVTQKASGDGHYITINRNGLYECNANGSTMGKGFVRFKKSENGQHLYEGNAFLGRDLSYVFNNDFSRLNLWLVDGTIYVYERRNAPSSNASKRIYESNNPVIIDEDTPDTPENGGKSNSQKQRVKYITCGYCKGTGRRLLTHDAGLSRNQHWVTCDECGQRYLYPNTHRHVTCVYCQGTGKRRLD